MRYDKPIYFQRFVQGSYNENTGNYEDGSPVEEMVMASVMDTKTQTMMQIYGQIRQGSLTCHIQNIYQKPFDHIRIGTKNTKLIIQEDSVQRSLLFCLRCNRWQKLK